MTPTLLILCWGMLPLATAPQEQDPPPAPEPAPSADPLDHWGQWRGPRATGEAPRAAPPLQWSEEHNRRWKTPIPGLAHSSPVVWGDRLYLSTAEPFGEPFEPIPDTAPGAHDNHWVRQQHRFSVLALDPQSGRILWTQEATSGIPHEGGHVTGSLASASPIADAQGVIASFGSRGLFAFDRDGALQWRRELPRLDTKHAHGEGSSPVLHDGRVVVVGDHEGPSFVACFDRTSGEPLWRVERDEVTSWSSPIVVEVDGRDQVIVPGTERLRAYDLEDGEVLWSCPGLTHNIVATPVAGEGMVFSGSSYGSQSMLAIRLAGARGDLSDSEHVVWTRRRRTPYVPSPCLYRGMLYFFHHYQGRLSRVEAATGEESLGPFRLQDVGDFYASPVAADGRIYLVDQIGNTLVLDHESAQPLALNHLDDAFSASPALVGDALYLRGAKHLYCLAED